MTPFADNLCEKLTTNLDELRRRVTNFMQLEKLHDIQNQVQVEGKLEKHKWAILPPRL